ncbi:tetratricopeptide repeat protein [Roseomonas sp. OT10]|uniref:tetratricopeptide repeat protein n=1 Tax=Roseomonas cutis TaxID=2897332 RepID=UPI001E4D446A|nr:tetratricopeptide repeat protein [Roseomonas sp. OT10]UFN51253.1 tetratricopeptide repeat protein [Roseomonas sp. OT10]
MIPVPFRPGPRLALLAAALLAGCAAGGAPPGPSLMASGGEAGPMAARGEASAPEVPRGSFGPYLAGLVAERESDSAVAAEELAEALRRDPGQPEVLRRAFTAAVMDGRPEATRLARSLPQDQLASLLLAGADAQAGRWDRAEQRLRSLPRQGAAQILQPLLIAWAQAGRGATDAALTTLRPWVEQGRLRGLAALHAAMIADLAGRPRDAERLIRIAITEAPDPNLRLVQIAAGILARAGREADGARLFDVMAQGQDDVALAASPALRRAALTGRAVASPVEGMAEAELALGAALRGQGSPELSLILARLSLRLRPGFTAALLLGAEALADDRHPEAGLRLLAAVPENDELAPLAALRRGLLLDSADRTAEGLAVLARLAEAQPNAAQAPARMGDILRARGRFAEAAAAYDQSLARASRAGQPSWSLLYAAGIALERSGRWPEAEGRFQEALKLSPEQPYVLNYLAYTWADRGERLPEARRMLERAAQRQPQDGNIADSYGWVLFRLGDLRGAVKELERAAELEPRNATVNDHLGDAYWALGRRVEARYQWSRALDLGPDPVEVPRIQAKLHDGTPAPVSASAAR